MKGRCAVCREPRTGGVDAHRGHITIHVFDEGVAIDLAEAFGRDDGFYREMWAAIAEAWPDGETETDDRPGLRIVVVMDEK